MIRFSTDIICFSSIICFYDSIQHQYVSILYDSFLLDFDLYLVFIFYTTLILSANLCFVLCFLLQIRIHSNAACSELFICALTL